MCKKYLSVGIITTSVALICFAFYLNNHRQIEKFQPIKIGATLALSGNLSYIGEAERNGMQLALDEINAKSVRDKKIQFITEDNQGNAAPAVSSIKKLLDIDHVDIVFSAFTHVTKAVKDEVKKDHKLMIYASTVKDIAKESDLFFRDYIDAQDHGRAAAQLAAFRKYKHVSYLMEKSDQCIEFEKGMKTQFEKDGITLVQKEEYLTTEKDLKTQLLKLSLSKPDAIIACSWRHETILMNQLKELGLISIPTIHFIAPFLPASDTSEMKKLYSENNALTTWYGFGDDVSQNENQKKFRDRYQQRFGIEATPDAAYAYDDIYVLSQALEQCSSSLHRQLNTTCIRDRLSETNYMGVGGKLTFNKDRVSTRDVISMKTIDGKWNAFSLQK